MFMRGSNTASAGHQCGFTLLEALISLVVLSVGMLGIAALQTRGMLYNTDAYARTQATALAVDIVERMRARSYPLSNGTDRNALEDALRQYTTTTAGTCTSAADVGTATVAKELGCWQAEIDRTLPGRTDGVISCSPCSDNGDPTDDIYQVTISWVQRQDNTSSSITMSMQP